jgi:tripartite-type tricarboxylate transporter receptor subunit TctC
MLAGEHVARAAPDGHTILIDHSGIVINPALYERVPFDVRRDLAPIILAVAAANILVAHPSLPAQSVEEFIRLAKARPGQINYASPSNGSPQHIDMERLKQMAGIDLVHVPYRGAAPAAMALLSNEVQVMLSGTTALPHVTAGTLRVLATTGPGRTGLLPDVPTASETALPGFESVVWLGFFAPTRTPSAVIDKLNAAFASALGQPGVRARLAEKNMDVVGGTRDHFARVIERDIQTFGAVVRQLGIRPD